MTKKTIEEKANSVRSKSNKFLALIHDKYSFQIDTCEEYGLEFVDEKGYDGVSSTGVRVELKNIMICNSGSPTISNINSKHEYPTIVDVNEGIIKGLSLDECFYFPAGYLKEILSENDKKFNRYIFTKNLNCGTKKSDLLKSCVMKKEDVKRLVNS